MKSHDVEPGDTNRFKNIFRAFRARNYRLFFTGQCISLIGTWMQQTALSWLVYRLTASSLLLGLVAFMSQVPSFFIAPFAGVLVDRWNRHRVLLATQSLAMLQATVLASLVLTQTVSVRWILFLSLFLRRCELL
jgi:MFS family permease